MNSKQLGITSVVCTLLMTATAAIPGISPWVATPIMLTALIVVPGILLAVNLRVPTEKPLDHFLYSIGLGLAFVLLGGLGMNWLLPHLGVAQPLAVVPLVVFFGLANLVLAGLTYLFNREAVLPYRFSKPDSRSILIALIPVGFVVMAILGAQVLNNGGSGILTLCMLFGIAIYAFILAVNRTPVREWVYPVSLYLIGLSLLLMYSLRSSHIFGWDINLEYQVFQGTLNNLVWKMSFFPGLDYNACTSITILPAILKQLSNIPSEYVFKVDFQLLFALVPVAVYAFARRYLGQGMSFLAAFLLLSQTWFFEQMPALIRQEMAFIFYILAVLVLFDKHLSNRTRFIMSALFTEGIVLSHYSTAYVWIALVAGVLVLFYGSKLLVKPVRDKSSIIGPSALVLSLVLLFVWQSLLTQTSGKITNFVTNNNDVSTVSLPAGGSSTPVKNSALSGLLVNPNPAKDPALARAEQNTIERYQGRADHPLYPDAAASGYDMKSIDGRAYVPSVFPRGVSAALGLFQQIFKLLVMGLLPVIGIIGMSIELYRRRADNQEYNLVMFSIVSYALVVIVVLVPYAQEYYNLTRLYLQMFFVLSVVAMIGAGMILKKVPRHATYILAGVVVLAFCLLTGAFDQVTGGQKRMTLNQSPGTLDSFYIYDSEVAGVRWLEANRDPAYPIQADPVASLRFKSFSDLGVDNRPILPLTLDPHSYLYLSRLNIEKRYAFIQYSSDLLIYNHPTQFIEDHKDLIYTSGGSRIYK